MSSSVRYTFAIDVHDKLSERPKEECVYQAFSAIPAGFATTN